VRDDKDRSGKWLIDHCGGSALRLAGVRGFQSWRPHQAEVVQPKQLPDGFLEVSFAARPEPDPFLLEIATYPERRAEEQVLRDALLVFLDRRIVPDVIRLVLRPKGKLRLGGEQKLESRHGWTEIACSWRVVELWTVPAEVLFEANDVGLIPWVPLTQFHESPATIVRECRRRIDQLAPPELHENLLAVTQVMTKLRYNDPSLLSLLGGARIMIESPLIREIEAKAAAKAKQEDILTCLQARFGRISRRLASAIRAVDDKRRLKELIALAARSPDLEAFEAAASER
jgi:hypothetical protein